jgi:tRNA (mo5U34)-methyltransferase
MGTASVQRQIEALAPWFHNLHLPDGSQTYPDHWLGDFPSFKWRDIEGHLPRDLRGWSCLDIGCNAGFYSFELARRGARVLGIDIDDHYLRQARWASRQFGLAPRVRFAKMQVYDLACKRQKFDLVLFMGVFYHLRYPLLGLDIVSRAVKELMVFQTLSLRSRRVYKRTVGRVWAERAVLDDPGWPRMAFLEHGFAGDPTNWWVPNHAACEAMLRSSGMEVIEHPGHEIYLCRPCRVAHDGAVEELRSAATAVRNSASDASVKGMS